MNCRAQTIERGVGMRKGQLTVTVRAAVAGHVLRQWQVDCSPGASLRGSDHRLALYDPSRLAGVHNAALAPGFANPVKSQN